MPDFLTVKEAAQVLNKTPAWVYRHASALKAFQPFSGCALSIPVAVIEQIKEGRYAVSDEKRTVARSQDDRGRPKNEVLCYKSTGKEVGSRTKYGRMAKGRDPYGLLD
jgi:hypothetical protein